MVPVTVRNAKSRQDAEGPHPTYSGSVLFKNKFNGQLPATDYPKVNVSVDTVLFPHHLIIPRQFYFAMFLVYAAVAAAWGWLCYRHIQDILPLQAGPSRNAKTVC